jgi:hypothetical protein
MCKYDTFVVLPSVNREFRAFIFELFFSTFSESDLTWAFILQISAVCGGGYEDLLGPHRHGEEAQVPRGSHQEKKLGCVRILMLPSLCAREMYIQAFPSHGKMNFTFFIFLHFQTVKKRKVFFW